MPDYSKGRHPRTVSVHDPAETLERQASSAVIPIIDETTLKVTSAHPSISEDATLQVTVRLPICEKTISAAWVDDAATTVINRKQLFAEAARLERAAQQRLDQTIEHPQAFDYLPPDIRPTIATPAIGQQTLVDQAVVQVGSWREFIVEVDDQLCLIVPIEIVRSGLLKPGRRLVVRIRSLDP